MAERKRGSLLRVLLGVLLPALALLLGTEWWASWRSAVDAANAAYDRSLLGAAKAVDANLSTASGGLGVELPYRMFEFFALTASGRVYFRVGTEDGLVAIGNTDLPRPPRPAVTGRPQFSDAEYFGEPVRIASYARVLDPPLAGQAPGQRVLIQVAETLESRRDFTWALMRQALARDILLALAATALLWLAVRWALQPLDRLRKEVQARAAGDLGPLAPRGLPADVLPLVEALNHHVERHREEAQARRRFVDDASHQLRTPLATLATQVGYALRETEAAAQREALLAIKSRLDETIRGTNQMLLLARADTLAIACAPLDLQALAQTLARRSWAEASERGIDLGLEGEAGPLPVIGHAGLLGEAVANLLHNALRYTPRGGRVTVRPAREGALATLSVIDDGPGIPAAELERVGERFFRGSNVQQPGTGLGLAIVRSVAGRFGGTLRLAAGPQGHGLCATLILPLVDQGLPAGFGPDAESELKVPGR